jgi:hypothetical protein
LSKNQDRVAIIGAIQDASSKELKALADIKNAITSQATSPDEVKQIQGRVSDRLSRAPKKDQGNNAQSGRNNPYAKQNARHRKKKARFTSRNESALRRRGSSSSSSSSHINADVPTGGTDHLTITLKTKSEKAANSAIPASRVRQGGDKQDIQTQAKTRERDSNGRFKSQNKNEEITRRQEQQNKERSDADLQKGFFRKLSSLMGMDGKGGGSSGDPLTDAAGVAAGGPLWMAVRGAFDITKAAGGKAVSMHDWINKDKDKKDSKKKAKKESEKPAQAISYPAAEAKSITPPQLGKPRSSSAFSSAVAHKSTQAVEEQTKVLSNKDDHIIEGLEGVSDEIVKLRKSMTKEGGFKFGDLFRKRSPKLKIGSNSRYSGGRGPGKPAKPKPKKTPGKFGKLLSKVGGKAALGITAGATAVVGGMAVLKKKAPSISTGSVGEPTETLTKKTPQPTESTPKKTTTGEGAGKATKATEKSVVKAEAKAGEEIAEKAAVKGSEKAAASVALEGGAKVAGKVALKTAARAVPLVGSIAMAGYDAVDGYNDTEGQQKAFSLKEGQEASTQQKTSYATANVADMGGLISGGVNLIGKGFSAIGMDKAGEALQSFDTGTIARGVDKAIDGAKSFTAGATAVASAAFDKVKSGLSSNEDSTKQVKKAVEDGTKQTVTAINNLSGQLQGGTDGQDGVGTYGNKSAKEFSAPDTNTIAADLNIGGKNAQNRNFRNNNLGNLVYAKQEGASLEAANSKGERRFAHFNTPEEGIRALGNQVSSYYNGTSAAAGHQKLQTVSSIISKWAPPNENNTNQYIDNVCDYLGVSPNEKIDATDPAVMTRLVRAIATKEGGNPAVNDDFIKNALGTFNASTGRWEGQFSDESLTKINDARAAKGEDAIARNSQYSAGSKVKLANGSTPATPVAVKNAVPLKAPSNPEPEVIQHAQTVKKPASAKATPKQPTQPEQAKSSVAQTAPASVKESLTPEIMMAALAGDTDAQAKVAASTSGEDKTNGSIAGFAMDLAKTSVGFGKDLIFSGGKTDALAEKSKQADKVFSAKFEQYTGKHFGFQKAAPLTPITQALQKKQAPHDGGTVDLLGGQDTGAETVKKNEQGIPVYNNGYRIVGDEDSSVMGSLLDSSINGLKRVGAAVLPTTGKHISRLVSGIDGNVMMDSLVSQATGGNTNITRAISPLTRKVGSWLDGGIKQTADGIQNMSGNMNNALFGSQPGKQEPYLAMPPQLPTVTDLARSNIRQPLTSDSVNTDPAMLKALENVYGVLKDILNVNKTSPKGDPDNVVKTAQPQPRQRASTTIDDPSLDALLKD